MGFYVKDKQYALYCLNLVRCFGPRLVNDRCIRNIIYYSMVFRVAYI